MQPKIYHIEEHQIPPQKIDRHAFYVIHKLREKGHSAYLVGGGVRDLLLNLKPKDFDISTSAKPEEVKAIFPKCFLVGRRFRLAHVRFGRKIVEVSTFRTGDLEDSSLIVRDNDFGTEEEDVLRRDFTINGLLYDPETQTVIDYVGGYQDLQDQLIRTIGQATIRFMQDPVRMIRLAKFQSRFNFTVDPSALTALKKCREEIVKSSQARILEELLRMLESGSSAPFIQRLEEYGLLELLLPRLHHLEKEQKKDVLDLLTHMDTKINEKKESIDRPILVSCLIYPLLEKKMRHLEKEGETIHLGVVAEKAKHAIEDIFNPFFKLSRRMKGSVLTVLTSQFRIGSPLRRIRIPKDPSFSLALHFFKLRTDLDPSLSEHYQKWQKAFERRKEGGKPEKRRRGKYARNKTPRSKDI